MLQLLQLIPIRSIITSRSDSMNQFHITKEDKVKSAQVLRNDLEKLRGSIPKNVFELITSLLRDTSHDTDVVFNQDSLTEYITPNQAASILQASRPSIRKLIDEGKLHAHKIGAHFKISRSEVLDLKKSWDPSRKEKMQAFNSSLDNLLEESGWDDK